MPRNSKRLKTVSALKTYTSAIPKTKKCLKALIWKSKWAKTVALVGNSGGGKNNNFQPNPARPVRHTKRPYPHRRLRTLRDLTLSSLRHNIAMVFQDNFLFAGTVREKRPAGQSFRDGRRNMAGFKERLPGRVCARPAQTAGYGNWGTRHSALRRAKNSVWPFARAFVKNAPVVILERSHQRAG